MIWIPCDLVPESGDLAAECATAARPLDTVDPGGPTIDVAMKRRLAPVQPARGQLWFVTGGPGDAGTDDLGNLEGLHALLADDLDLYTLDHRGTGGSGRLSCPVEEDPDGAEGFEIVGDEWAACVAHVEATYADLLPFLTVTASAADLVALTDEIALPDDEVYWWGVSYGTFLVERALHLAPDRPDGVLLDGLVPADWSFVDFDAGLDRVARGFLEACGDDPGCAERMDGDPIAFAEGVLDDLEDGHCARLGVDAPIARLLTGVLLMSGERYAAHVPAVWVRLERCKARDVRAFVHLFDTLFPEGGGGLAERPGHSPVMQRHVAYAELWDDDAPSADALADAIEGYVSTTEVSLRFRELADDWPVVPADPRDGTWPATDVPILALHGGLDPTMPVASLGGFETWLDGPHQRLVVVPNAHHVTLNMGDCPISIYAAFLADPEADPDLACIDAMPPPDWHGDPDKNAALWGTEDRWGDPGCGCGGGQAAGFGLLPLLWGLRRRRRVA